jgi:transposase-like protein
MGYSATGRRYGVSDNAIRKWIRQYEIHEGPAPPDDAAAEDANGHWSAAPAGDRFA